MSAHLRCSQHRSGKKPLFTADQTCEREVGGPTRPEFFETEIDMANTMEDEIDNGTGRGSNR
jgi:hypothetical protein